MISSVAEGRTVAIWIYLKFRDAPKMAIFNFRIMMILRWNWGTICSCDNPYVPWPKVVFLRESFGDGETIFSQGFIDLFNSF